MHIVVTGGCLSSLSMGIHQSFILKLVKKKPKQTKNNKKDTQGFRTNAMLLVVVPFDFV